MIRKIPNSFPDLLGNRVVDLLSTRQDFSHVKRVGFHFIRSQLMGSNGFWLVAGSSMIRDRPPKGGIVSYLTHHPVINTRLDATAIQRMAKSPNRFVLMASYSKGKKVIVSRLIINYDESLFDDEIDRRPMRPK